MNFGLKENVIQKIQGVFQLFPEIEEAIIFGSRATNTFQSGSDIDIVLKGDLSFKHLLKIESMIDDLLLPYTIDLLQYKSITEKSLLRHIDQQGLLFYTRIPIVFG